MIKVITSTLLLSACIATGSFCLAASSDPAAATSQSTGHAYKILLQKNADLPVTSFNLTFRTGSANDPKGREGLALLTARLMRQGGVKALKLQGHDLPARDRNELEEVLFPMAAEIDERIEKEQTSLTVTCTAADAETVFRILAQLILAPAFQESEFERIRGETLDSLTKALPRENEEELGKAALTREIYGRAHPYSHVTEGTVEGVRAITLADIRKFHQEGFTQNRLILGVAGVVSSALEAELKEALAALPKEASSMDSKIPPAPEKSGLHLTLVKGAFDSVGEHLGEPLSINRASPDFPALFLGSWAFGKHRSFVGRLMKSVREVRGLNYGTYSYVEEFPGGGQLLAPPTQAARTRQDFTVWVRPTTPPNSCFLLRQVFREVSQLAQVGLSEEEFKLTQSHLIGTAPLLAVGLERRLGYAIDSEFYGIHGEFLLDLQAAARKLTRTGVNALLRKNLHPQKMELIAVTSDPEKFREEILSARCPITYPKGSQHPPAVLAEDKKIEAFSLGLKPEDIRVVDAESVFRE